jgi:hypothetical protein
LADEKPIIYEPSITGCLRQGEILTNVVQIRLDPASLNAPEDPVVDFFIHPFALIVSQDCDLDWDFKGRHEERYAAKKIPSVLFCEVTTAAGLRGRSDINSTIWQRIRENKDERYHFLEKIESAQDAAGEGLPELGIDFKRYFSIPAEELYARIRSGQIKRRCRLVSPYAEHFSLRFAYYLARVALPLDHQSEPTTK